MKDRWCKISELSGPYCSAPFFIDDKKRNQVQCMRCIWCAVFIDHVIGIAMVCSQEDGVTGTECSLYNCFYASVYCFYCFNCGWPYAGMSHHISVCIIKTDKRSFALFNFRNDGSRYF